MMTVDNDNFSATTTSKMMVQMNVPCIMVDANNFVRWWPSITKCMQQSDFIALDLVCKKFIKMV